MTSSFMSFRNGSSNRVKSANKAFREGGAGAFTTSRGGLGVACAFLYPFPEKVTIREDEVPDPQ